MENQKTHSTDYKGILETLIPYRCKYLRDAIKIIVKESIAYSVYL